MREEEKQHPCRVSESDNVSSILKHRGKEGMLVKHRYCQSKGKRDQPELGEHAGSRWRQTGPLGGKGEAIRCLARTQA